MKWNIVKKFGRLQIFFQGFLHLSFVVKIPSFKIQTQICIQTVLLCCQFISSWGLTYRHLWKWKWDRWRWDETDRRWHLVGEIFVQQRENKITRWSEADCQNSKPERVSRFYSSAKMAPHLSLCQLVGGRRVAKRATKYSHNQYHRVNLGGVPSRLYNGTLQIFSIYLVHLVDNYQPQFSKLLIILIIVTMK